MKHYDHINAVLKRKNRGLYWTLLISLLFFLIGTIVCQVIGQRNLPDPIAMNDAIVNNSEGEWCYIDVDFMSDYFAVYEEDEVEVHRYYFVWDKDYLYIVLLPEDMITEELADIYSYSMDLNDEIVQPNSVRICGITEKVSAELKTIAMDQVNEWYGEGSVTEQNFDDICGSVLLNTKKDPNSDIMILPIMVMVIGGMVTLFSGVILFIYHCQSIFQLRKMNPMEIEAINEQIGQGIAEHSEGVDVYFTKQYLVDFSHRFLVVPYQEIDWSYLFYHRSYGMTTSISIKLGLRDGKMKEIAVSRKKCETAVQEVLQVLSQRCPDLLVGYSKENKKAYKQKIKGQA